MGVTSFGCHTRPACHPGSIRDLFIKKVDVDLHRVCFSWLWGCEGTGAIFMVCACAVGLCGNGLTGMRGVWGDNWRSAHVPTIPFTWLRRANAWAPTAHASNYQALLSIKLCKQCGFNSCVRVFFIPMGHVGFWGKCDVTKVTWVKCAILIGRDEICCALIGYRL